MSRVRAYRRETIARPCMIPVELRDSVQVEHLRNVNEAVIRGEPEQAKLRDRLLEIGGWEAVLWKSEPDLGRILAKGEELPGKSATLKQGEPSECHGNTAQLWDANKDRIVIMTGYALSADGLWRQHSWAWDRETKRVIETTVKRELYFGFKLTDVEAQEFYEKNYGWMAGHTEGPLFVSDEESERIQREIDERIAKHIKVD